MEELKNQEEEQVQEAVKVPRVFTPRGNKRNMIRQVVVNKDGSTKVIWHSKKFNGPLYADYSKLWREANTTAKIKSKRQRLLRGESIGDKI